MDANTFKTIYTSKARCRDCYRCLRVCPVKAIRMVNGQAFVDEDRCISCGTCVLECPQKAKYVRNDVDLVKSFLNGENIVAVSLAPSFAAVFDSWKQKRIASALRKLGFKYIAETSIGAAVSAHLTAKLIEENPGKTIICSACPAIVNYIEKYQLELVPNIADVVSPMIAHARLIRKKMGADVKVVFIGPCVAKKTEARRPGYEGMIDAALTFNELEEWFARENLNLAECEESSFDETPEAAARFFPIVGGLSKTAMLDTDILASDIIAVSGFDDVRDAILNMGGNSKIKMIEPLFCHQGCINGPAMPRGVNLFERRLELINFAGGTQGKKKKMNFEPEMFRAAHRPFIIKGAGEITEEQIRAVLEKTGKLNQEDHLNCGACGYNSCRDKAIAVILGMAEVEMCIPYMKILAERRTDKIIETSPNGIIILDDKLNIISMNATFKKLFMCTEVIIGKRISYLIDPTNFEKLSTGLATQIETIEKYPSYNLICHEVLYCMPGERQYVGIFMNITNLEDTTRKLETIKSKTVERARELLEHQVNVAQQMAKLLGEMTARGEELVRDLMKTSDGDRESEDVKRLIRK